MKEKEVLLKLETTTYQKIKSLATRDNRSFSEEVEHILLNYITHVEEAHGIIDINKND